MAYHAHCCNSGPRKLYRGLVVENFQNSSASRWIHLGVVVWTDLHGERVHDRDIRGAEIATAIATCPRRNAKRSAHSRGVGDRDQRTSYDRVELTGLEGILRPK